MLLHAGLFHQQLIKFVSGTLDLICDSFRLSLARASSSTDVCGSECVDVVCILTLDQAGQILVIEALACASDGACDLVIGKIDLHWLLVAVEKSVEVFCFHWCVVMLRVVMLCVLLLDQLYAVQVDLATCVFTCVVDV